jgi:hypothetical protein
VFEPGPSIDYTYLNYRRSGTIFSTWFATHSGVTTLPSVLAAIPRLTRRSYVHTQSTPMGVYFGISLTRTFCTFTFK